MPIYEKCGLLLDMAQLLKWGLRNLTWDGNSQLDFVGISDPVKSQGYHMLAPEDVLCITATCHWSDFTPAIKQHGENFKTWPGFFEY